MSKEEKKVEKKEEKKNEDEVFVQKVDDDELEDVTGGLFFGLINDDFDEDRKNCTQCQGRKIHGDDGTFPNCAGTVEEGSWCDANDACAIGAIDYYDRCIVKCPKAWA